MPFSLLPAIDLLDGRLGLLTPNGPVPSDAFAGDAIAAATAFRDAGASWVHVVDMGRAFTGRASSAAAIAAIARVEGLRVQASGGIRTAADADAARDAGATRVVLSSSVLGEETVVGDLLSRGRPGDVVVGVEVDDGRIRSRGAVAVDLDLTATLGWLRAVGAAAILVTAVGRVATERGPDVELVRRVVRTGIPTIAAGGVGSLEDLRALREAGAVGAVVGRAALDGTLDLAAALAWAGG